jgi:uncharacterized repeat protein (TIGR01451 family)
VAAGTYTIEVVTTSLPVTSGTWTQTAEKPAETAFDGTLNSRISVTLISGEINGANDFGYHVDGTASIGDQLFFDLDKDLVQDVGEEGIPGVSVNLYYDADRDGQFDASVDPLVSTVVSDATGKYLFSGLDAGTYFVAVDQNDPDFPAGVTPLVENPASVLVYTGTARLDVDFPYYPYGDGSISGSVWNDRNFNQVIGAGEPYLPSIEVELWVDLNGDGTYSKIATTTTDASGNYSFSALPYGDYRVVLNTSDPDIPLSYSGAPYSPTTATSDEVVLTSLNKTGSVDFGLAALPSIGDFVYYDSNANGTQDTSELGIGGVTVRLFLDSNSDGIADGPAVATTTTATGTGADPAGYYQFVNVQPTAPGQSYIVVVDTTTLPYPMLNSGDPDRDGVAWTGTPDSYPAADSRDTGITVTSTSYSGADFGYVPRGVIGDYVWIDINADGVQDPGEIGLSGVTVRVTNGTTTYTTVTDSDGRYSFANLPAGTWTVTISGTPLNNMAPTFDADGGLNNSTTVTINSSGQVTNPFGSLGVDFGLKLNGPYTLSGTVVTNDSRTPGIADDIDNFLDDKDDFDVGPDDETELAGQTLYLYQLVGGSYILVSTTTTDANGDYAFVNLPDGDYKVVLDKTSVPLQNTSLSTTAADTPASTITVTTNSVIQAVAISGANVEGVDYAFIPTAEYDFGDLPWAYNATALSNDGARHIIPTGGTTIYLGTAPDADIDGPNTQFADGDDRVGIDDEDGVQPLDIASWVDGVGGGQLQVTVPAGKTGYLVGWIDFDHDDTLIDKGEMIISQVILGTGSPQTIIFDIPAGTIDSVDESWLSRFRIFSEAPAFPLFSYTGVATDGEVEDHLFRRNVGAAIGDRVWMDTDADGVQDDDEFGIAGVTVRLKNSVGAVVATMTTSDGTMDVDGDGVVDPVGYYRFGGLAAGTYSVEVVSPAGYTIGYDENSGTTSPDGVTSVSVVSNDQHLTADFGLIPTLANISGSVFYDANHNNTFGGDSGFGAVTVQLWTDPNGDGDPSDGIQVAESYTGTDGAYLFEDVPSYRYVIVEVDPKGYVSDADTSGSLTDNRISVVLAGVDSTGNNYLDDGPALMSIGGTVFNDGGPGTSSNNTFDASDTPLAGVTLTLYIDADGNGVVDATDPMVDTTVTGADGTYSFANLPAGKYLVKESDPEGFLSDTPNVIAVALATTSVTGIDFLDDERGADGDLAVTKTDGRTENIPGGTTVYTIVVSNSGPTFASGARVVDDVPSELTGVTWTATYTGSGSTGAASGTGDIDTLIQLASGGTATFTVTGTILTTFTDVLTNTATVTPPNDFIDPVPSNNTATDTTDVIPAADLSITKIDNKAVGTPGQSLGYTIVVTNNGPSGVIGATVSDPFPDMYSGATWTAVYAGTGASGPASGTGSLNALVDIPVGATATFTVTGTIASSASGTLLNTATVTVPTGYVDTDLTNNSDSEETPLVPSGDLRITKTDSLTTVTAGETLTYTIEAWNAGPSDVVNARVNDLLPAAFTNVTWTASYALGASGPTSGTGSLVNVLVNLPATSGAKATFLVTGTIAASTAPGTVTNTATIAAPSGFTETNLSNNSATDVDTLVRGGDLSITKSDGLQTTSINSTLHYTIVVTNHGPSDVTGATVTDTLPPELVFVSATGGATYNSGNHSVSFTSGTIAAGGTTSFVITATVNNAGPVVIANTAIVTPPGDYIDTNGANNSATDTTNILFSGYDLQVTKTDGRTTANVGDTITYTIVVSNSGPANATNVEILDTIPSGISNPTWTATADSGVVNMPGSGTGNISILPAAALDIPAGKSVTIHVTGIVAASAAGQTLTNTVVVSGSGDVNTGNNTATDTTNVTPQVDLHVTKSSTSPVVPGADVTYTIVVTNNGPIGVSGANVTDVLPAGTTFVSATGNATHSGGNVSFTTGNLANGASETFTVTLAVSPTLVGTLSNTATVSPPSGVIDSNPSNNSATDVDPLVPTVDLQLLKTTKLTQAIPGLPVTYTIEVTNVGPSFASGATVTDTLPLTLSDATWDVTYTGANAGGPLKGSGNISTQIDLPVGGTATFVVTATLSPTATGTLTNTASVAAPLGYSDPTPANNSDPESLPIVPKGDLSIVKTDNVEIGRPGESLEYTIVVTNHGPSAVNDAVVDDSLPAGFTGATWGVAYSAGSSGSASSGTGSVSGLLVDLLAGGTATITITGTIVGSATGTLSNTASVVAPAGFTDTDPSNNADTEETPLVPRGDLSITKTDGKASTDPGTAISYTIVVTNAGPNDVTAATLNDTIPSAILSPTWTATYSSGSSGPESGSGSLSALSLNLLAAGTATFTVTGMIDPTATGTLTNTATITPPTGFEDTDPTNNSATDTTVLDQDVDLTIAKTNNLTTVVPGRNTTYAITVTNNGPINVTGATVTDVLPAGTTFVSATGGATYNSLTNTVTYVTGQILATNSESFTVTLAISPTLTGTLTNTAQVVPPAGISEKDPSNNTASDSDPLTPQADLRVSKSNNLSSVVPGTNTTYTITVSNDGPSSVSGATVADVLPAGTTFVSATGGATYDSGTRTVTFVTGTLAKNGSTTFTVTLGIAASLAGTLSNTATVTTPAGVTDPHPPDNTSTDTDPLRPQADLRISKTNNATSLLPGTGTTYAFQLVNDGPSEVTDAIVTDVLPAGLTFVSATGGATYDPATRTISFLSGLLGVGATKGFTVAVDVSPTASGSLTNSVTVTPPAGVTDPHLPDNTASDTDPIVPTTNLKVEKTNNVTSLVPGELTTYTITVTNEGPAAVNFASITDQLPSSLVYVSSTGGLTYNESTHRIVGVTTALAVGGTFIFDITAEVKGDATGSVTNTVTVAPPAGVIDSDPTDDTTTDTDPLVPTVDLTIVKTNNVTSLVAGNQTTYTITVTNDGPSTVTGATVSDVLPAGTTFVSATNGAGYFTSDNSVRRVLETLATGASFSFDVTILVKASTTGNIANTATVTPPPGFTESDPTDNSSTDTDPILVEADLRISKTNGVTSLVPGAPTTYTITVTNDGPSSVTGATVTDVLPSGLTFVSATGGATHSGGAISFTAGAVAPGGSESFTVTVLVGATATGSIANTATVAPPSGVVDPDPSDNSATDTDPLVPTVDLRINKSNGVTSLIPGTQTTYTIVVTNGGPSTVTGATVADVLPSGLTFVSATGGATHSSGTISLITGTLAKDATESFTVTVLVGATATGSITNTATVTAPSGITESDPTNNVSSDTDPLIPTADLLISKTNGVTSLAPGAQTTYTITVTNAGPSTVTGARVSDVLPAGLTYVSATGTAGYFSGTNSVQAVLGTLATGDSESFTVTVLVGATATGSIANTAAVAPPAGVTESDSTNNSATDTDPLVPMADLRIAKSNGVNSLVPGTQTTYTITVTNDGPSSITGASVVDVLPSSLTFVSATGGATHSGGTISHTTGTLATGVSESFTVTVLVGAGVTGSIANTASVTPPSGVTDPDSQNNSSTDTDPVSPTSDLRVTKTNGVTGVSPGAQTTYTITVFNDGPSSVTGATVADVLPSGLTFVSATGGATHSAGTVSRTAGTIAQGGSESFTVTVLVGAGATGNIVNTAVVTPPAGLTDSDLTNNSSSDTDPINVAADLRLSKSNGVTTLAPGAQTTYTFVLTNDGPHEVTGAIVEDVLPAGLTYVSSSAGVTYNTGTRTVRYVAGQLLNNATATFTLTVAVDANALGTIVNTATVSLPAGVTDPDTNDNTATDSDPILTETDLSITKSNGSGVYQEGGTSIYTIVVRNHSNLPVTGVRVQDALTSGMVSANWSAVFSPGSSGATSGTGAIDHLIALAAGGSATYTFRAVIGTATAGKLVNTAIVTPPAGITDTDPNNNSATDTDKLPIVATGTEVGCKSSPMITVIDPYTGRIMRQFTLFEAAYRGGVRVSVGDVDGDGVDEIVAAPGAGRVGEIRVFKQDGTELTAYRTFPFGPSYRNGVEIAVGDIDGDGDDDIVAAASRGPGDVRVFQVNPGAADPVADTPIKSFRAFAASFQGGATVAVADLGTYSGGTTVDSNVPDGKMEIVVGSGAGMRATVQNYDVSGTPRLIDTLLPLPSTFRNGVSVSSARVNGDAIDDIIVSSGRGGSTVRETFDGRISPATNALLHRDAVFADIGATAAPLFSAPIDLDGDHIADKFFHTLGDQGNKAYPGVRSTDPAGTGDQTIGQLNFSQRIAASRVSRTQPIQTTASGLMIQDVRVGDGAIPAVTQLVTIHFVATTPNGSVVRNTRETLQPLSFRLDSTTVMPGLREAIQSMRVGGTRRVIVPPSLQTGSVPSGLPTGNELVFEIELISATN